MVAFILCSVFLVFSPVKSDLVEQACPADTQCPPSEEGDVVEFLQRRTQEHNAENATQKTAKESCNVFHFTASYNGKEYAAECKGEYMNLGSSWECVDSVYPGFETMIKGVRNCASEDGAYDHIPADKWDYYHFSAYGKRAEWIDSGYSDSSEESCRGDDWGDDVDCVLYTK